MILPHNAPQASLDRIEKALSSLNALTARDQQVRRFSEDLCQPLSIED